MFRNHDRLLQSGEGQAEPGKKREREAVETGEVDADQRWNASLQSAKVCLSTVTIRSGCRGERVHDGIRDKAAPIVGW